MIIIYYNVVDMDRIVNNDIIRINGDNRNYDYNDNNRYDYNRLDSVIRMIDMIRIKFIIRIVIRIILLFLLLVLNND